MNSMIVYQRDNQKKYDADIKRLLRAHNEQFSNIHDFSEVFVYILKDERLIGALKASYFWDWVSTQAVFYRDTEVLKQLVKRAWDYYKEKAFGMKSFTTVKERLEDFVSIGFSFTGTIQLTNNLSYYYADLTSFEHSLDESYQVLVTNEPIKDYQKELDAYTERFNKEHRIEDSNETYDMAALDVEQCIGGL
jgi:hypothetical protein